MRALPTVEALARAKPGTIHKLWEGLGYYTRVRNLQKAAQLICRQHGGRFPTDCEAILELPGIGRYTAGAICSIAFNQPTPILDGNVTRVLARLFGVEGNPREKAMNAKLWRLAEELVREAAEGREGDVGQRGQATAEEDRDWRIENRKDSPATIRGNPRGHFLPGPVSALNQALMELGALVCTPRQPQCGVCPVASCCRALRERRVEELPATAPRPRATPRRFAAFVVQRGERFLVRQRPPGVVNGHLWEFPNVELASGNADLTKAAEVVLGAKPTALERLCVIRHSITRYRICQEVFGASGVRGDGRGASDGRWLEPGELARLPFTGAHKKILAQIERG
jgi:A/G-specific adenine glycosylase